jgi:hypothetical protein
VVVIMDITLERILSLIPKKEDGKFKHGALSAFARKLGFKDGHIVSDWIAGNSTSYLNYLYQISVLYNVSVEWLKGETDIKNPDLQTEAGWKQLAIDLLSQLTPEELDREIAYLQKRVNEKDN